MTDTPIIGHMSQLDEALSRLKRHDGVRHILLLGRDGLPVRHLGGGSEFDADTVSAMIPAVMTSCAAVGRASELGDVSSAVVELAEGVVIVVALPADLLLTIVLEHGVGFAPLLQQARRERDQLAGLL